MHYRTFVVVLGLTLGPSLAATAHAQAPDRRWSVDFALGFDNSISGNINSGAIGVINNQTAVVLKNRYEDVYGTGLNLRFGGGYYVDDVTEVRLTFTFQSLDADLVRLGDLGASNLYGQYADYQSFGLDAGFRRYANLRPKVSVYGEGTLGIAFVDETDLLLAAPGANLSGVATDFYDRTAAFTLGANAGAMFEAAEQVDVYVQAGLRYVTGMSKVDAFAGTGLESINDHSARWAIPFSVGIRVRF